jgi:hypothetical protein
MNNVIIHRHVTVDIGHSSQDPKVGEERQAASEEGCEAIEHWFVG